MNIVILLSIIVIALLFDACVATTESVGNAKGIELKQNNQLIPRTVDGVKKYGFIGGNYTSIAKYPYTVSIGTKNTLLGAGAIINSKWVITAASVIYEYNPWDLLIRAGSSNSQTGGQLYTVKRTFIHDDYSYYSYYDGNDIALIQITNPFKFGASVRAIKLANEEPPAFSTTVSSGFGGSYDSSTFSDGVIKEAYYQAILIDSCQYYYQVTLSDKTFCISTTEYSAPCDLDYGNPFVYKKTLVGIYQYEQASSCDDVAYPPIVTSVAKFTSWIDSTIKNTTIKNTTIKNTTPPEGYSETVNYT